MADDDETQRPAAAEPSRRQMLAKLGIAAGAAYAAPVLLGLGSARASSFSSFSGAPRARRRRQQARRRRPPPEIVVAAPVPADIDRIAAQGYGLQARARLALIDAEIARFSLPPGRTLPQAREEILRLVPAALIDLNHLYRASEVPCRGEACAAFEMIGWAPARACGADIAIGMIDTGVDLAHEALVGATLEHSSVIGGRRPSSRAHGTAVAALLAGRAGTPTPGLLSGARLIAVEAFHADAAGRDAADAFDIARALDRLAAGPARVVNMSLAGPPNTVLERVVRGVLERDIVLVAAGGNAGPAADPLYPAAYDGVVAVTAVDREARPFRQAAAGAHIDFAAPGVRLWTAAPSRGGRVRSGTSYAAPFVSAALAVLRAADPAMSGPGSIERLAASVSDLGPAGRDPVFGWGMVRAPEACAAAPGSGGS